jgi:aminodeoxychorismate synthase component I
MGQHVAAHLLERLDLALPFWRYHELHRHSPYAFLLDSAQDPRRLGRFSFMGSDPARVFTVKRLPPAAGAPSSRIEILDRDGWPAEAVAFETQANPFDELRRLLQAYRVDPAEYLARPVPFLAGAVGYFGYGANHFIETLPDEPEKGPPGTRAADGIPRLPDICLMLCRAVMAHCHQSGVSYLSVLEHGPSAASARRRAEQKRDHLLRAIERFGRQPPAPWTRPAGARPAALPLRAHFDQHSYAALVERARQHILAGDVYQVCLTHRLETPATSDPWNVYQELRAINPAPFACFLQTPEVQVVSSSPERFLRLDAAGVAESRPIKGTSARGPTPAEDRALAAALAASSKDIAENNMIVDLVRNDLGRVCQVGTVHVAELRAVETYATVHHLVSTIRGQLRGDRDAVDLLRACFPGGSMTGAPKIQAMKIIDRLEPVERGVYSGSIGYLDLCGTMDLNIVIRTLFMRGGQAWCNVGGAVVADSSGPAEYAESMDKARALIAALENVEGAG